MKSLSETSAICARSARGFMLLPLLAAAAHAQRSLPALIITATRDSSSSSDSPLPSATLDSTALRREHGVSLAQTLVRLPGVRALSTGEQIGKPMIRGLSGSRVLVLDNGLRLEDYSWSDEDGPSVDARLADRVEVIRGPASVLYGSDALGGVVNVIPAALPNARGGASFRRGQAELYGASNNLESGGLLSLEGARGRMGARLSVVGRFGGNLRTPAGAIRNTGFLAGNGDASIGVHHEGGAETALRFAHYGGEYQLLETDAPVAATTTEEEGGPARITLDDRLQLVHSRLLGSMRLEARAQLQRHNLQEKSDLPNPVAGQPKEATVFDLLLNTATTDLLLHHGTTSGIHGTLGASGMLQQNDSRGIIPLVPHATITSGGVFAFEQLTLGRITLLAGARGDARHLSAAADARFALASQSRSYTAATGDLGAVYHVAPSLSLAANGGAAWRAPNLFELFANGPRIGDARYELGNVSLTPEHSLNGDASLRWTTSRLRAEVAAFHNTIDNYIYIAPTSATQQNLRVYRYAQADAHLTGGELSATAQATDQLSVFGRFDALRGTNTTTDDPLPLVPPQRFALGAELHSDPARNARSYARFEVEHVAAPSRLSTTERSAAPVSGRFPLATAAYTVVDLAAGTGITALGRAVRLDLRVRNAANTQYRDFLSRYKEFAYAPGANVSLRASTAF